MSLFLRNFRCFWRETVGLADQLFLLLYSWSLGSGSLRKFIFTIWVYNSLFTFKLLIGVWIHLLQVLAQRNWSGLPLISLSFEQTPSVLQILRHRNVDNIFIELILIVRWRLVLLTFPCVGVHLREDLLLSGINSMRS